MTANTFMGITWSAMLMLGAAIGGLTTSFFGTTIDFIVDSCTYMVSAICIYRLTRLSKGYSSLSEDTEKQEETKEVPINADEDKNKSSWQKYKDGLIFLWHNKYCLAIALAKGTGTLVWGGAEVAMIRMSAKQFRIGDDASMALSILYLTSGLGVSIAPVVAKRLVPDYEKANQWMIVFGFVRK
jgi:hypothetical protein